MDDLKRLRLAYERRGLLSAEHGARGSRSSAPPPLARELLLADGLLRNVVGRRDNGQPPQAAPHITVFGGTQVGKSTVVNVLAGRALATVHHTAGYTRHAQGFTPPGITDEQALSAYPFAFPGFQRVPRETLSQDRPMEYSLEELAQPTAADQVVLWDAPDCDAVDSSLFQQGFVEALTLAQCVVYVTSREKYAVNSILAWVVRLRAAGVPVAIVLNMTPADQQQELVADMKAALSRVAEMEGVDAAEPADPASITAFEYVANGDVSLLYDRVYTPAENLRQYVTALAGNLLADTGRRRVEALRWINGALPAILEPAALDLDAWQTWNTETAGALNDFVKDYRQFYLDDPQRYDAFNRVGLQILELLNPPIPGLAKTLTAARNILSIPARALLAGGKAVYRMASGEGASPKDKTPYEVATFQQAHNRLLNRMARFGEEQRRSRADDSQAFWQALHGGWEARLPVIEKEFRTALAEHRARTDTYVREAAEGIYAELAKEPVKLNLLRSGRIAADAAAIVISIKTGGPGDIVHDLVVAPALMSVVEAVSRQLAGNYVEQRKAQLRRQLDEDTRAFAADVYGKRLRELADESLRKIGLADEDAAAIRTLPERVAELLQREEAAYGQ